MKFEDFIVPITFVLLVTFGVLACGMCAIEWARIDSNAGLPYESQTIDIPGGTVTVTEHWKGGYIITCQGPRNYDAVAYEMNRKDDYPQGWPERGDPQFYDPITPINKTTPSTSVFIEKTSGGLWYPVVSIDDGEVLAFQDIRPSSIIVEIPDRYNRDYLLLILLFTFALGAVVGAGGVRSYVGPMWAPVVRQRQKTTIDEEELLKGNLTIKKKGDGG
jgi:hypothetical protein